MKIVVSSLRKGACAAGASATAIAGQRLAFISGLFCLVVAAILLSACQQPLSSAQAGSPAVQQGQGGGMEADHARRCCRHAARSSNH